MEALINLLAKYFGLDPAVLYAVVADVEPTAAPSGTGIDAYDSSDASLNDDIGSLSATDSVGDNDDSNEYVNGVYVGDSDNGHDESNDYVNGVHVGDNDHNESNEYVNGDYVGDSDHGNTGDRYSNSGTMLARSSAGYSEISDDRNDQYRFELNGSELADGGLVDAGEEIVAKYELGRRGWEFDRLDSDESLAVQVYNNEAFIVETEYERSGKVEFKIFSDLDGDQIWTEVVEGEVYTASTAIDLVGLVDSGVIDPTMLLG